jgi:hypothetical protein
MHGCLAIPRGLSGVTNCWLSVTSKTPRVTKPDEPALNATTTPDLPPRDKDPAMLPVKRRAARPRTAMSSIDKDIRDFLAGKSDGADLLHTLYDYILDEPVPRRLRALLDH